ncbi:MAG TPA: hypothetical protein PK904_13155 [Bacteroidales bacterium]|nr:hypothetical protein [Bacteroidales bacterium]
MMKTLILKSISLVYLFFLPFSNILAQDGDAQRILSESNLLYGSNDFIERGFVYIPDHPKANGNPYYLNADWNKATITFIGDEYEILFIKYNIVDETVILQKGESDTYVKQPVILNSSQIDQFQLAGQVFTNLNHVMSEANIQGFGEILYAGQFHFIRKYSKTFMNQYNKTNPNGLYSKLNTNYFIIKNDQAIRIYNKSSLINAFPGIQKQLKKKLRDLHFKFRKANNDQWIEIMSWCDKQS